MNVVSDPLRTARFYEADDDRDAGVRVVLDIARRRWRTILGTIAVTLGLAIAYLATAPDRFSAKATLLMDTRQVPSSPLQTGRETLVDPAVVDSQVEILKSQHIAEDVVDSLHLDRDPDFAGGPPTLSARLIAWFERRPTGTPSPEDLRAAAAEALTRKVKVMRVGHSYLAEITATTLDPKRSADVANALADAYIRDLLDDALKSNARNVAWMNHRVAEVKAGADAATAALAAFDRDRAAASAPDDAAATAKRKALADAAESAGADYAALQNRSLRLAQFIQQQSLPVTEARVLTYADPPDTKSAPRTSIILLLALVGGGVFGAGLAWLRDSLDRKLRRPRQIQAELGLPVVGKVPAVRGRHGVAALFDPRRPWCGATEALRSVKLAVDQNLRRGSGGVALGMASAWPGEGKSTLVLNLALLLSEVGARVLVVDADLRQPDLSSALEAQASFGLADLVEGTATVEACIARDARGFDVLGCGTGPVPLHPFGVLGSRRMQAAIAGAQSGYDYVLVDLPAMLASVDAQAIAPFLDAFILVAESGRTSVDDVRRALSTSDAVATRIVAAVLNKARGAERGMPRPHRRHLRGLVSA